MTKNRNTSSELSLYVGAWLHVLSHLCLSIDYYSHFTDRKLQSGGVVQVFLSSGLRHMRHQVKGTVLFCCFDLVYNSVCYLGIVGVIYSISGDHQLGRNIFTTVLITFII